MDDQQDAVFGIGEADERRLWKRIAGGDKRAESQLLAAYEPLVATAARRCARSGGAKYDDLLQQGTIGLLGALKAFDPSKGVRFGVYAKPWVEGAIKDAFGPADRELSGLAVEDLEDLAGRQDDVDPGAALRSTRRRPRRLDELVGKDSGRDAYLMHHAAGDADVRALLADWLAENRGWTLIDRGWQYLRAAEPELVAQARRGGVEALAKLEQKYSLLHDKLGVGERGHTAEQPRIGPDPRSTALATIVARAIEKGSLSERAAAARRGLPVPVGYNEIAEFRQRYLGGELLGEEQIVPWVEEQARREGPPAPAYLRVTLAAEDFASFGELDLAASVQAYASWLQRTATRVEAGGEVELPEARTHPPAALLFGSPEESHLVRIRADGTLARLKIVVASLLERFDSWFEEEAVAFVLAGVVPPLDKLRAQTRGGLYRAASRIRLDCDPRIAPAEVAAFYEKLRERWVKGGDRGMEERGLALAAFTEEHWRPDSSWSDLYELWNSAHSAGDPLHSEVSLNQFRTECRVSWERLSGELWPGGKRAKRKLQADIIAARKYRHARLSQRPGRRVRPS